MRAMVMILVGIVLVGIGWFWWRGDVVNHAPAVSEAAAVPLPVVTGPYDPVASECRDDVAWSSVHTRPWQSLAQEYEGAVDACMEVYKMTADEDDAGDYYLAVVTSAWSRTDREDFWYPWDGDADAPSPVTIAVITSASAIDGDIAASSPSITECVSTVPAAPVLLDGADVLATPTVVAGTCGGAVSRVGEAEDGASWTVTRPEEFDLTVMSYRLKVAEGELPAFGFEVTPAG